MNYFTIKLNNNLASPQNCIVGNGEPTWYKHFDETTKRQYFEIQDYKIKVPGSESHNNPEEDPLTRSQMEESQKIKDIMKTKKSSSCTGDCCIQPNVQINANDPKSHYKEQLENEKCICAKMKVECGPNCPCDPKVCTNRQMSMK